MSDRESAQQRVEEIDAKLRSIESGNEQADAEEVSRLNAEREELLNTMDDEL